MIFAPKREHSRKPEEQYDRLERLVAGPYVELFARQSHEGWATWGNERTKFDMAFFDDLLGGAVSADEFADLLG